MAVCRKIIFRTIFAALALAAFACAVHAAGRASDTGIPRGAMVMKAAYYTTFDFNIINLGWEGLAKGGLVHVRVYRPDTSEGPFPSVVMVPPANRAAIVSGRDRWNKELGREMDVAEQLASKGMATVLYNPPGQGIGDLASTGEDGRGGFMSQDALAQVIHAARLIGFIDVENIGVCSTGSGLLSAAGALARRPDMAASRYLIDIDGPWDNLEITGYTWRAITPEIALQHVSRSNLYYQHPPTSLDPNDENAEWWSRREPGKYAEQMAVKYYQRVQYRYDTDQPPDYYAHALRMYEAALASQIPHARFNTGAWDAPLPLKRVPELLPGRLDENSAEDIVNWITNLAFLNPEPTPRELPPYPEPDRSPLPIPSTQYHGVDE